MSGVSEASDDKVESSRNAQRFDDVQPPHLHQILLLNHHLLHPLCRNPKSPNISHDPPNLHPVCKEVEQHRWVERVAEELGVLLLFAFASDGGSVGYGEGEEREEDERLEAGPEGEKASSARRDCSAESSTHSRSSFSDNQSSGRTTISFGAASSSSSSICSAAPSWSSARCFPFLRFSSAFLRSSSSRAFSFTAHRA